MQPEVRRIALAVIPVGFLLGFLDFVWIKYMPAPFAELGNSMAVWAVAAFFFGLWVRSGALLAALTASAMLVVAVPSYYVAAALIQNDDWANLWAPSSWLWMGMGVIAGVVFGIGGTWARKGYFRWETVGAALPGAVFFAEATLDAARILNPDYGPESAWDALLATVLGIVAIGFAGRTNRHRARALLIAVPLALVGYGAFRLVGIQ
jgi:hypothetical protein